MEGISIMVGERLVPGNQLAAGSQAEGVRPRIGIHQRGVINDPRLSRSRIATWNAKTPYACAPTLSTMRPLALQTPLPERPRVLYVDDDRGNRQAFVAAFRK